MGRRSRATGPIHPLTTILAGLTLLACGSANPSPAQPSSSQPPSTQPPSKGPNAPSAGQPSATEPSATEPAASATAASSTEASEPAQAVTPEPARPDAAALCERLCERVASECKEKAAATCRASCSDYVAAAARCPVEVEDALSCQATAQDAMVCANIVASTCVPAFSSLSACRSGEAEPRVRAEAPGALEGTELLPPGWARVDDGPLVVSLPLPSDASAVDGAHGRRLAASEGEVEFLVESPQRFRGEATDKALLKAVLDYLGTPCHKALKVHGRFEKGPVVHVNFATTCKDGVVWKGMLHVHPERMVVTAARSTTRLPENVGPKLDALFYGFRFLD